MSVVEDNETALFDNNQQLEESQTFIAELLHKLDVDKAVDDAMEVKFMISNMEGILGQFSETSYELQHEINDILESSKQGLLTHDKLSEMIAMEQTRSNCVNGIVNSLKVQIENLYNIITEAMNNPDDDGSAMNQLQMDMGMMMKSVDSLTTVITSPVKKLDMTIKKIDSELIVHLNDQYKYSESWAVQRGKSKMMKKVVAKKQKPLVDVESSESSDEEEEVAEMAVETPKEKKPKKKKPSPLSADDGHGDHSKTPSHKTPHGEHATPTSVKKISSRANSSTNVTSPHPAAPAATPTAASVITPSHTQPALESHVEEPAVEAAAAPAPSVKPHKEKKAKKAAKHSSGGGKKKGHHVEKHRQDPEEEDEEEEPELERSVSSDVEDTPPVSANHGKHHPKKHNRDGGDSNRNERHTSVSSVVSRNSAGDHHGGGGGGGGHGKDRPTASVRRGSRGSANVSSNNSLESTDTGYQLPDSDHEGDLQVNVPSGGGSVGSAGTKHSQGGIAAAGVSGAGHSAVGGGGGSASSAKAGKPRPAPLHKVAHQPRGSRPTSPTGSIELADKGASHSPKGPGEFHTGKTPDHASALRDIQMKNRENALLDRERALERRIAENDKVIEEKVAEMLEAKKQFESRLKKSLSQAGYIKKSEVIEMIDKKDKAKRMLRNSVSAENGEITLEDCFENTDLMEMIVTNNPDLTPEEVIQKIMDLFNNPANSPQFRKAIILSLMTGDPLDLEAAEEIYQAVEEKLVEEVVHHTHNEEDGEHIRQHLMSPGGTHPLQPPQPQSGRRGSSSNNRRSFDMRNGTPYMTKNDFVPLNTMKEQQFVEAQMLMSEIATSNRRNEVTDELYGLAFKNLQRGGNLARVEAIKIVAPYNNETITCQATSTEDLDEFIASQSKEKKPEELPKIITDGVSGFISELEDLSVQSPTQLNLSAVHQQQSSASPAQTGRKMLSGRITDRMDTPATAAALESRSELQTVQEGSGGSQVASQPMFEPSGGVQGKPSVATAATTGGDTFIFYGGTVESPLASTSRVISSPEVKGLPVFDNKYDVLLTRTYQPQPHVKTFNEFLEESENPLYTLYAEYHGYLSRLQKIRLASAALTENKVASDFACNAPVRILVSGLLTDIMAISKECEKMLSAVASSENIVGALVSLLKASKAEAVPIISNSVQVHELFRYFGEIEACKIGVDLQMHEFRALFERINAISIHELANTMKESVDFSNCYKYYLSCQGQILEIHQRLMACKDRCERYKLIKHEINAQRAAAEQMYAGAGSPNQDSQFRNGVGGMLDRNLYQENERLREENEILTQNLETADEDIADLEEELLEIVKEKDRAPSALLFFTLLHDPSFIQTLQQLVLQLSQLRPFAEGNTTHIDFVTMKKRIQVCIVCIPGVEKLLNYYSTIYSRWATHRNNYFVSRSVTGGAADNLATCPLCYNDLAKDRSKDVEAAMIVTKPSRIRVSRKQMRANALQQQHQTHHQQQLLMSSSHKNLKSKLPHI